MHRAVKSVNKEERNKQNYEQIECFNHSKINNPILASYININNLNKTINSKPNNFNHETNEI